MSVQALKIIDDAMTSLGIEYGFVMYSKSPIVYPYFEGEYNETESFTEDGLQESSFVLMGYSRDTWLTLEKAKEKIRTYFDGNCGRTFMNADGSATVISYANSLVVPVGEPEIKRIQINLQIKEWRVN